MSETIIMRGAGASVPVGPTAAHRAGASASDPADPAGQAVPSAAADVEIARLAETFKVLASPTRLRLIEALSRGELCVCDLADAAGVSQSAVSHHLASMRALRLVRYRKESRMAFYRLDDDHIGMLFRTGLDHVRE